jgi:rhodanese-related sulfurtransferase
VDANAGTILPEQIPAEDYKKFYVLDVRDAAQFAKEHVPGAANARRHGRPRAGEQEELTDGWAPATLATRG